MNVINVGSIDKVSAFALVWLFATKPYLFSESSMITYTCFIGLGYWMISDFWRLNIYDYHLNAIIDAGPNQHVT